MRPPHFEGVRLALARLNYRGFLPWFTDKVMRRSFCALAMHCLRSVGPRIFGPLRKFFRAGNGDQVGGSGTVVAEAFGSLDDAVLLQKTEKRKHRARRHSRILGQRLVARIAGPIILVCAVGNLDKKPPRRGLHRGRVGDFVDNPIDRGVGHQANCCASRTTSYSGLSIWRPLGVGCCGRVPLVTAPPPALCIL